MPNTNTEEALHTALERQLDKYNEGSLTLAQVSKELGVSVPTVEKLVKEQQIHAFGLDQTTGSRVHVRVPKASLISFMMTKPKYNEKVGN